MKVAVDAGHGGKDSGAVGKKGLRESNVVLAIAKMLAKELTLTNHEVMLVRDSDVFVELGERCAKANAWKADIFVSVHLNSDGPEAKGVETLYKTEKGKVIAGPIQRTLVYTTGDIDRGLKLRNDLAVLNGTNMPAVLVECGFISNPTTEGKLGEVNYQQMIADAICSGIIRDSSPPSPPPTELIVTVNAPKGVRIEVKYD